MRNVSGRNCREIQNSFYTRELLLENRALYEIMWNNMAESQETDNVEQYGGVTQATDNVEQYGGVTQATDNVEQYGGVTQATNNVEQYGGVTGNR
jgi:hypothetical protein